MESLTEQIQELVDSPHRIDYFRSVARSRIQEFYNWEWITDFYVDLFDRMLNGKRLISYEEYLDAKNGKEEGVENLGMRVRSNEQAERPLILSDSGAQLALVAPKL